MTAYIDCFVATLNDEFDALLGKSLKGFLFSAVALCCFPEIHS